MGAETINVSEQDIATLLKLYEAEAEYYWLIRNEPKYKEARHKIGAMIEINQIRLVNDEKILKGE